MASTCFLLAYLNRLDRDFNGFVLVVNHLVIWHINYKLFVVNHVTLELPELLLIAGGVHQQAYLPAASLSGRLKKITGIVCITMLLPG